MDKRPPRPPPPTQKGTVTSLASMFPAEEAHIASQRVQGTLAERQKQLDQLREFISDNASLINLVQRLPDELHHNIMVPFGKAAFFPGKLVHTNEFLVLLGEGYYADRTSKQTVDILKRRGNDLETQVEAVRAVMQDLKAEASFFDSTAAEAAEGLVEIREDYVEEASPVEESAAGVPKSDHSTSPEAGNTRGSVEDEEYNRIFSRMAELEKEEEEAEKANENEEDEEDKDDLHHGITQHVVNEEVRSLKVHHLSDQVKSQVSLIDHSKEGYCDPLHVEGSELLKPKHTFLHDKGLALGKSGITKAALNLPEVKESVPAPLTAKEEVSVGNSELGAANSGTPPAVIGTIVERTQDLEANATNQKPVSHSSSKPVSRFKLQRK